MASPLFSVVIPTYNRCDLVAGAVRSVLRQTCEDLEVVVSDNCSEDDTEAVVRGFQDSRVRYVRTASHTPIADSWESARSQARGALIMMLSDDDALVPGALARFAEAHRQHEADFLFCNLAEYRDGSFLGPQKNTVSCRPFSGITRVVTTDELLRPLFAFRPKFDMHPSAFIFASRVAERIVQRCGRFFMTNGVEYFAWPLTAVFSRQIVYLSEPLVILGRTAKSWGSTIVLSNPGKDQIAKMIADVEHDRAWVPLKNFTLSNLMAEGLLLGKQMFPDELAPYPFDEQGYLTRTMTELRSRQALGVDVDREMSELLAYAAKYPSLQARFLAPARNGLMGHDSVVRKLARAIGLNNLANRLGALNTSRRIRRGTVRSGFTASGYDFGFDDAIGCADFIARVTHQPVQGPITSPSPRAAADTRFLKGPSRHRAQ